MEYHESGGVALLERPPVEQEVHEARLAAEAPKAGVRLREAPSTSEESRVGLQLVAGTIAHAAYVLAHTYPNLTEGELTDEMVEALTDEVADWLDLHYGDAPLLYQEWSAKAMGAAEDIDRLQLPEEGHSSIRLHEVRIELPNKEKKSTQILVDWLTDARVRGYEGAEVVENILRAAPFVRAGESDADFDGLLNQIPVDSPLTAKQVLEHIHMSRQLQFALGGDLIVCPTTRADIINLEYADDDLDAAQIAKAYSAVLDSGRSHALDLLVDPEFEFGDRKINGLEAAYKAAQFIRNGRLKLEILDLKTLSHVGNEEMYKLWDTYDGDLDAIFSPENLAEDGPKYTLGREYDELRREWRCMRYDMAKSMYAFRHSMSALLREYAEKNPDELPLDIDEVIPKVGGGIILMDFNVLDGDKPPKSDHQERDLGYDTLPSLTEARIPSKVAVARKNVSYERAKKHWSPWEHRLYKQIGEVAAILALHHQELVSAAMEEMDMAEATLPEKVTAPLDVYVMKKVRMPSGLIVPLLSHVVREPESNGEQTLAYSPVLAGEKDNDAFATARALE